ncbi:hypothetical protein [Sanguibacter suaedae]|uniref:Uncharacterized protein n=1 Tax=Sanguibacter suaedae TaxID=2795737 RepID=A0A934IDF9_9MICO|nr:hypothetical protein [Sanguibacter suaedae]MBI9115806.1 hypothetical protein [Sanguibacter suaedae]
MSSQTPRTPDDAPDETPDAGGNDEVVEKDEGPDAPAGVETRTKVLWLFGGAVGLWFVLSGVLGVLTP